MWEQTKNGREADFPKNSLPEFPELENPPPPTAIPAAAIESDSSTPPPVALSNVTPLAGSTVISSSSVPPLAITRTTLDTSGGPSVSRLRSSSAAKLAKFTASSQGDSIPLSLFDMSEAKKSKLTRSQSQGSGSDEWRKNLTRVKSDADVSIISKEIISNRTARADDASEGSIEEGRLHSASPSSTGTSPSASPYASLSPSPMPTPPISRRKSERKSAGPFNPGRKNVLKNVKSPLFPSTPAMKPVADDSGKVLRKTSTVPEVCTKI